MDREEWFFIYAVIFLAAASFFVGPRVVGKVEAEVLSEGAVVKSISSIILKDVVIIAGLLVAGYPFVDTVFESVNRIGKFFASITFTSVVLAFVVVFGGFGGEGFKYFVFNIWSLSFTLLLIFISGIVFRMFDGGEE